MIDDSHDTQAEMPMGTGAEIEAPPEGASSSPSPKSKGKAKAVDIEHRKLSKECRLLSLPVELIASILSYLTPADLDSVSETCGALYRQATDDHLWQILVQRNVPGQRVTSPYPCLTFRDLFWAHEPRWFLPRYKIWFSDAGLPGRLIVARYDQRRGCIEGYQLLATNTDTSHIPWQPEGFDSGIRVSAFAPEVRLHLDNPVLRLPVDPQYDVEENDDLVVIHLERRQASDGTTNNHGLTASPAQVQTSRPRRKKMFQTEIPMRRSSRGHLRCSFIHAQCLKSDDREARTANTATRFPYGHIWPPPSIPSQHCVMGAGLERPGSLQTQDRAVSPRDVYEGAFRIRKWLERRELEYTPQFQSGTLAAINPHTWYPLVPAYSFPTMMPLPRSTSAGEEIATYATLYPSLYTPTPSKPFRGIFVGDYGPHGCEFIWIEQHQDDLDDIVSLEGESDEDFAARKRDATIYRGSLEAVKLTGDPNVPRGEITFYAPDLGEDGFVRVAQEPPFLGVRVVRSKGHVANEGFAIDAFIDGELLLISPDCLAHHWIDMGRVSYFHRVDIDRFLVPG
ncbi:hypothetical protein N657DRAFT_600190 [Parathielavia appendiculata]|uniref:F-box domain-containing protein n=1 Tax=Parathielavia appendiculata TaxID=2587402 RepID=A0AAN6Z2T6_9PEZI|nr:hypothetical protein N657DRAFT_600190 [Parathielavia appendiculata]